MPLQRVVSGVLQSLPKANLNDLHQILKESTFQNILHIWSYMYLYTYAYDYKYITYKHTHNSNLLTKHKQN